MIQGCIHTVRANSINSEILQEGQITGAGAAVGERVSKRSRFREGRPCALRGDTCGDIVSDNN